MSTRQSRPGFRVPGMVAVGEGGGGGQEGPAASMIRQVECKPTVVGIRILSLNATCLASIIPHPLGPLGPSVSCNVPLELSGKSVHRDLPEGSFPSSSPSSTLWASGSSPYLSTTWLGLPCDLEGVFGGAWVARLVKRPTLDFGSDLSEFKAHVGLCADGEELAWGSVSNSLCLFPTCACAHTPSLKNK